MSSFKPMDNRLRDDILQSIQNDSAKATLDQSGRYLQKIECPNCGKAEAFINADNPWVIKCGREKRCGAINHIKEVYPELFETWTERYQPKTDAERQKNPHAVANGYLRDGRGFELEKIQGWYTQEYYHSTELDIGSSTVRFKLPNGFWERLLDKPQRFGRQKARIVGNYKGEVWCPDIFTMEDLATANEIWIVEGIFDDIALYHAGIIAVSNLSSGNYPDSFLARLKQSCGKSPLPTLVWAQDGDRAGRKAIRKFRDRAKADGWQNRAAQPPAGKDWNDLYQLDLLQPEHIKKYLYQGDLLLANSAAEKALLMYKERGGREFWLVYDSQLYWWKLDIDAYDKEIRALAEDDDEVTPEERNAALQTAGCVTCICTALPTPLYFQANHITDESWYYFSIEKPDGTLEKKAFTPKQLTNPSEFKNRLLAIKNSWWTGMPRHLDRIMQDMMHGLKTVDTVDFIGYSKQHKAYIYNEVAIKDGRVAKVNEEDFFQFGKLSIKSLSNQPELQINSELKDYQPEWAEHLKTAFSAAGIVTLAYWLGCLFAEQIRETHQSFPFFELVGEAGAGKTTLIEFLWKLVGRPDWEGLDPNKMTAPARARYFSQVSNLPIVLIEADRDETDTAKAKQFDWDDLKPAYNGRPMRSRGVKNSGNDTYEPPMRGAIFISQNAAVDASEAILSRILHITVTREHHTIHAKNSADWLARIPTENVSGFVIQALKSEKQLLTLFANRSAYYEQQLSQMPEIRMVRIAKNHAQLLALIECLGPSGLRLFDELTIEVTQGYAIEMAMQRQAALSKDNSLVVEFWEAYEFIEGSSTKGPRLNHSNNESEIAINLKEFESWCGELRLRIPEMRQLKQKLRSSKSRKFIKSNHSIRSKLKHDKTVRCWVFQKPKT